MREEYISNQQYVWKRRVKTVKQREDLERFDVSSPGISYLGFILLLIIFVLGQYYYLSQTEGAFLYMLVNFGISLIPILLMSNLGPRIADHTTFRWLQKKEALKILKKQQEQNKTREGKKNEKSAEMSENRENKENIGKSEKIENNQMNQASNILNKRDFKHGKIKERKVKRNNFIQNFLGFPSPETKLYLEAYPVNLDTQRFSILIDRIKEILLLSIGLTFTITQGIFIISQSIPGDPIFTYLDNKWDYGNREWAIIDTSIWMGPLALLLLFSLIPFFWINEDAQIFAIDSYQNTVRIGRFIREGPLSKILGLLGILLVFDVAMGFTEFRMEEGLVIYDSLKVSPMDGEVSVAYFPQFLQNSDQFIIYFLTIREFLLIVLACGGSAYLSSIIYLIFFHKKWVNRLRESSAMILPIGSVLVTKVPDNRLTVLKKTGEKRKIDFRESTFGVVLQIILLIATAAACVYLGFIF